MQWSERTMAGSRPPTESASQHLFLGLIVVVVALYKRYVVRPNGVEMEHVISEGGLHIFQPFMKKTHRTLLNDRNIWQQCVEDVHTGSFWMDRDDKPVDIWEDLAIEIWKDSEFLTDDVVGYEYWCNILTPEIPLSWHKDKDEKLMETKREWSHPVMGAVLYGYPHEFEGGELEVITSELPPTNPEAELESIQASYDRLIILNVTHWHRVTPITAGFRVTFAVNIWKQRPTSLRMKPRKA